MASLHEILSDPKQCGVFRYKGAASTIESAAKTARLSLHRIDLSAARGKDDLLARFAQALKLPAYFDRNWDALDECLSDLEWLDAPGWLLVIAGASQFAHRDEESLSTTLEVLQGAAEYWSQESKPFWAVVLDDGTTKDLAKLKTLQAL